MRRAVIQFPSHETALHNHWLLWTSYLSENRKFHHFPLLSEESLLHPEEVHFPEQQFRQYPGGTVFFFYH
jgi:hypothetical protein